MFLQANKCFYKITSVFIVPIKKEVTRIDKNEVEITVNISYTLKFIDSARFMASSLLNLVNNLFEGIHEIKCKYEHDKNYENGGIKCKYCNYFLEYSNFTDDLTEHKCLCSNTNHQ